MIIGVHAEQCYQRVVEEFFQLFKIPWEFAVQGRSYKAVIVSGCATVSSKPDLVIRYCVRTCEQTAKRSLPNGQLVQLKNRLLPIYGSITLEPSNHQNRNSETPVASITENNEATGYKETSVGYNLFAEVEHLLDAGQSPENASFPTLDLHIQVLRELILEAGFPLIEIPPVPYGSACFSCLTHDIDFVSMRQHAFDRTMLGFLYRTTFGSFIDFMSGRRSTRQLVGNVCSLFKVPFVLTGLARDFWLPFPKYLEIEKGKPSSYFIIPFKNRPGRSLSNCPVDPLRATRYDAEDISDWLQILRSNGCEVALHGIDAWNDKDSAKVENERVSTFSGAPSSGLRMHWLFFSPDSAAILDQSGFDYDSTCGYNEAVGYKAGTSQVFKPLTSGYLLELPMHIQDTALFYPGRMHLTESRAWDLCQHIIDHAKSAGGVVTVLWHDRSLVPERLWGEFYARLLENLQSSNVWFGTARQVVSWFRQRRDIRFVKVQREMEGEEISIELEAPARNERNFALRLSWLSPEGVICSRDVPVNTSGRELIRLSLPCGAHAASPRPAPCSSAFSA
jgi:hypothetical protein